MDTLIDNFGRRINYLRISVTDRCNLRCKYCLPADGIMNYSDNQILTFEEIVRLVRIGADLGITRVRITGGEPLLRKDIDLLIKMIAGIPEIEDISMTTNGILLKEYSFKLKKAGLHRINISLDTFDSERFKEITRNGEIDCVLQGIREAIEMNFKSIKINVLIFDKNFKDDIKKFLNLSFCSSIHIRFLEYMPIKNSNFKTPYKQINIKNYILNEAFKIGEFYKTIVFGNGTSEDYKFINAKGTFGFITPMSNKFCKKCNRLRITSNGLVKVCLHSNKVFDIKKSLRKGLSDCELKKIFLDIIKFKPIGHNLDKFEIENNELLMCQIGG